MDEAPQETKGIDNAQRYATPTFASSLPRYQRGELERIRNSFHKGSHYTIRQLPPTLAPGHIETHRSNKITENLTNVTGYRYKAPVLPHCFGKLNYQYNDYLKETDLRKCNIEEERVKVDCWSRKPFTSSNRIKLLHEDTFSDENYKFPDMGPGTGIPRLEKTLRPALTDSSSHIHGQFHSYVKKERQVSKGETRIWTKQIYEKLSEDWPHLRFKVKFTDNDELLICFPVDNNHIVIDDPAAATAGGEGDSMMRSASAGGANSMQNTDASAMVPFDDTYGGNSNREGGNCNGSTPLMRTRTNGIVSATGGNKSTRRSMTGSRKGMTSAAAGATVIRYEATEAEKCQWEAITRYMRQLATHGIAAKVGLQKRGDRWRRLELEAAPPGRVLGSPSSSAASVGPAGDAAAAAGGEGVTSPNGASTTSSLGGSLNGGTYMIVFSFYAPWIKVKRSNDR